MSDPMIECHEISKSFKKGENIVTPLEGLNLTVDKGDFLALMGPSGSGKSTLLNLLSGIDTPTTGTIVINDVPIHALNRRKLAEWRAYHVGHIFQLYHLIPVLTAYENVELPLLLHRMSKQARAERVNAALKLVGLEDRLSHYPRELSGGQEQRVAIARSLVGDAGLLVADEPTGDLDRKSADAILELLKELSADHGKTIVMVTHDPRAAEAAGRTLHLEKGQLYSETQI